MVTITLQLRADGTLDINGPTENRLVFLGRLELARDAVNHHHHKALEQRLIVATPAADLKGIKP